MGSQPSLLLHWISTFSLIFIVLTHWKQTVHGLDRIICVLCVYICHIFPFYYLDIFLTFSVAKKNVKILKRKYIMTNINTQETDYSVYPWVDISLHSDSRHIILLPSQPVHLVCLIDLWFQSNCRQAYKQEIAYFQILKKYYF